MFEIANIRTISRNSRYQNCAHTAEPSERFVVEYEVSDIHR
jgi:putative ribosome biogenesis GTPase RsgA